MDEQSTCIVCLGDLREVLATLSDNELADIPEHALEQQQQQQHGNKSSLLRDTKLSSKRYQHHLLMMQAAYRPYL